MAMQRVPLASQSAEMAESQGSTEHLLNLFAEQLPAGARSPFRLRSTPGLVQKYQIGPGPIHAMDASFPGLIYIASGTQIWKLGADTETPVYCGNIDNDSGVVSIAMGPTCAVIVASGSGTGYVINHASGSTLQQITDTVFTGFGGAQSVAYLDGWFLFVPTGSQSTFFASDLLSPTKFNALNFASAESRPIALNRIIAHAGDIWLFGEGGAEIWYDAGTANFAFARRPGTDISIGCLAPQSICEVGGSLLWLSHDGVVYQTDGYQPRRVSTPALEQWIQNNLYFDYIDATAYSQGGHQFYVLNFWSTQSPTSNRTLVYDLSTQRWHDRSSTATGYGIWLGRCCAQRGNLTLVGDRTQNIIYNLDQNVDTEAGLTILRRAVLPPVWSSGDRMFLSRIEVETQAGMASNAGTSNITLDMSRDGGNTWPISRTASCGLGGDFGKRVVFTRLGAYRQCVMRLSMIGQHSIYAVDAAITPEGR